jgi:hypothetical protein
MVMAILRRPEYCTTEWKLQCEAAERPHCSLRYATAQSSGFMDGLYLIYGMVACVKPMVSGTGERHCASLCPDCTGRSLG